MSDRPDHEESGGPAPEGRGLIVVPYRPRRGGARFLPPLLILMLGVGFLGYRVSVRDWRGASRLFEPPPATLAHRATEGPRPLDAPTPADTPDPPHADRPTGPPSAGQDRGENVAGAPRDTGARDRALGEIEREADETRKRIAALEAMKDEESRRLAETAPERRQQARRDAAPRLLLPPAEIERRLAAQREMLRRQVDAMMRRQMDWIDQARRRQLQLQQTQVFRGQSLGRSRGGLALGGRPGVRPGVAVPWPPAAPRLNLPAPPDPQPPPPPVPAFGRGQSVQRFRTPDGGQGEVRQFQGPAGAFGLELRWRSGVQGPPDDPPPPPRPALGFD